MGVAESDTRHIKQEVCTRWNSQFLMMESFLKIEPTILSVLAQEDWRTMKSLVRNLYNLL
jgi:hypothetical protein